MSYAEQFKVGENKYVKDPEYPEELELEYFYLFEVLDYGATVGTEVFKVFVNVMEQLNVKKYPWPLENLDEGSAYIILSKLYDIGAIDYGTSIRGSWLNEIGEQMLGDFKILAE